MCEQFSTLPSEGGLFDQDHLVLAHMLVVMDLQAQRMKRDREKEERKNR